MKYDEYIMNFLRQRFGLESDDNSLDNEINKMTEEEVFNEVCNWNGLYGWGTIVKGWIRDIYRIDVDNAA
jgi:hypothetical protein